MKHSMKKYVRKCLWHGFMKLFYANIIIIFINNKG